MDIKRIIAFVLLGAACLLFGFLSSFIYAESGTSVEDLPLNWVGLNFTGTVDRVLSQAGAIPSMISVKDSTGRTELIELQQNTCIFLLDPARGLTEGDLVKIKYRRAGKDKLIARCIRQLKPPPGAATPAAGSAPTAPAEKAAAPAEPQAPPAEKTTPPAEKPAGN